MTCLLTKTYSLAVYSIFAAIALIFSATVDSFAQSPGTAIVESLPNGEYVVRINQKTTNDKDNLPQVKVYEIVKQGDVTKTVLRTPPAGNSSSLPGIVKDNVWFSPLAEKGEKPVPNIEIKLKLPPPSAGFIKYEIDVSNYLSEADTLNYRLAVLPTVSISEVVSANKNKIRLKFSIPSSVKGGCKQAKQWILRALKAESKTTLSVTRSSNETVTYEVLSATDENITGEGVADVCFYETDVTIKGRLPVAEALNPSFLFFDKDFINQDFTVVDNPSFASFRDGVKIPIKTTASLIEAEKRDEERKVVFEAGGGLTTVKQKEEVTDPKSDRETTGFLDLRAALPTINYFGRSDPKTVSSWWSWTPLQFEAMISEGKLNKKNISTNTMRLFTQVQFVKNVSGETKNRSKKATDFIALNFEGGAAADRDLRVIDYTGAADFRWEPGFLNRTLDDNSETGKTPAVLFELIPAGIELGRRQERRDAFFPGTDSFIRRYRFGGKLEFQFPPYAQLSFENRSWIRWEAPNNKFRSYFKTSLSLFPRRLSDNFSAGVFMSYEVGSLPPFSTPATSTFKIGFRVRRKQW